MKKRSNPWVFFTLVFLLVAAGGGFMEYLRQDEVKKVDALAQQVSEAQKKEQQLKSREAKLKATEKQRTELEARLLDLKDGNLYAQHLMNLVNESRSSGAKIPQISFATSSGGNYTIMSLSTSATGSEAQVLQFIRLLEEGAPLGRIDTIAWGMPVENGQDPNAVQGTVTIKLDSYGPLNLTQPKAPATDKK